MDEDSFRGDAPFRLSDCRVFVWGLGLMGGSLALALRGRCAHLDGADIDPEVVAYALASGVVERASTCAADLIASADLIVLAAPVRAILQMLAGLPSLHPGRAVVLDLGSTKQGIVSAMKGLPPAFGAVGGHPMCGKETGSIRHAAADLFAGAPFALVRTERTNPSAADLAEALALAVGASPLWVGAAAHDRAVAATSHAPYLVAAALALATPFEASPLVGPGWRSAARLAGASPAMMLDVLATNRPAILAALRCFQGQLGRLEALLEHEEYDELAGLLTEAKESRESLVG